MKRKSDMTAAQVLAALRDGPFRTPAFQWLYEVRNRTGYGAQDRYADALVVSVWPSRGVFFAGIEVKISRADWKRELDDPEKSDEIQRFCDYWYIAAPDGVVLPGELPERWGQYVIDGKKATLIKDAPQLTPEPLSKVFVASVLRNCAQGQAALQQRASDEGWERARAQTDEAAIDALRAQLLEAQRKADRLEQELTWAKRSNEQISQAVRGFEKSAGLPEHAIGNNIGYMGRNPIGEQFKAAGLLASYPPERLAELFREVSDALSRVAETTKGAA